MLERKRILSPTATKEVDGNKMLFYENKKTGEVFIVRDPDLRLDELAQLQDEVAMLLGFGGPAADAAKSIGMKFTPDGKLVKDEPSSETPKAEEPAAEAEPEAPAPESEVEEAMAEESADAEEPDDAEPEDATEEAEAVADESESDVEEEAEHSESKSEPD
jgi:hypothetical protein